MNGYFESKNNLYRSMNLIKSKPQQDALVNYDDLWKDKNKNGDDSMPELWGDYF